MDIKKKLERLDKSASQPTFRNNFHESTAEWIENLQIELNAKVITENNSYIIQKENIYPLAENSDIDFLHLNSYTLPKFENILGESESRSFNIRESIFIDLETTGLAGGTGTFAFLIGIGYIEHDHIIVRQYILPDFDHEWLALKLINNFLLPYKNIVSFNGKTYDIPLLKNRFILNKMDTELDNFNHIDILHPARRLWKRRLQQCDLQNLEFEILNQERIDDIPGALIPQIYFEFIRKRRALLLKDILEHNYFDIVNLILLTIKIGRIVENPLERLDSSEDLLSLAQYYYKNSLYEEALSIYGILSEIEPMTLIGKEAIWGLAMVHKKRGDYNKTGELMKKLLENQKDHPLAILELAKYFEHKAKDLSSALAIVEQSLKYFEISCQLERRTTLNNIKTDLKKRQQRLLRKIDKANKII
jgi:uncharacterized protein YprB with RNaseH-like and TPR domain